MINYELLERLLEYLYDQPAEGAILVFLPGLQEITKLVTALQVRQNNASCALNSKASSNKLRGAWVARNETADGGGGGVVIIRLFRFLKYYVFRPPMPRRPRPFT